MRAPQPPGVRERKRVKPGYASVIRFLSGAFTILLVIGLGIAGGYAYLKNEFDKPGPLGFSTVFQIPKGEGGQKIARRLEREGVIKDARLFFGAVRFFGVGTKLKAGEYEFAKKSSMRQVLDTLLDGKSILYKISLPEGLTSYQMVQRINSEPLLKGEVVSVPPEGSLLPDTYKFSRGTTRKELIDRMRDAQQKFIKKIWQTRTANLPFNTQAEAIILASVVEKETGQDGERKRVAGVFVNRLRQGIRLQSDPTIIYGIIGGKGKLGRGIRRSEINRKTAYNTYQIDGLPPTPIANPGRDAIEAVLNPAVTKDLFFVADGTGGHVFAATLAGHQKNVREWRRIEKKLIAKRAARAAEKAKLAAQQASTTQTGDASVLQPTTPGTQAQNTASDAQDALPKPVLDKESGIPLPTRRP